jgi:FkbM family methyltransferase
MGGQNTLRGARRLVLCHKHKTREALSASDPRGSSTSFPMSNAIEVGEPSKRRELGFELGWRWSLAREYEFYWRACQNWREVVRCRRNSTPLTEIVLRSGIRLTVVPGEAHYVALPLLIETWRDQVYVRDYGRADPGVIMDVGAHVGFFALYAAARWPHAEILAFEPDPQNFALLQQNITLNRARQIQPYALAVSDCSGHAQLVRARQSDAHSLVPGDGALESDERIDVSTITLGEVLALTPHGQIDLMKVDCEGAEFGFLVGQASALGAGVGYIAMEYHEWGAHKKEELVRTFSRSGFDTSVEAHTRLPIGKLITRNRLWQ